MQSEGKNILVAQRIECTERGDVCRQQKSRAIQKSCKIRAKLEL